MMYVAELASRRQGLDMLDDLEKGRHLDLPFMHLEKCAALIIEPQSAGMASSLQLKYNKLLLMLMPVLMCPMGPNLYSWLPEKEGPGMEAWMVHITGGVRGVLYTL